MDRERDSTHLWVRRSGPNKLSLATEDRDSRGENQSSRVFSATRRSAGGDSSHSNRNPFNNLAAISTAAISSPTGGASSAFGLGSGAFASFGSASKTPKTPGTAFDFGRAATGNAAVSAPTDKKDKAVPKSGSTSSKSAGWGGKTDASKGTAAESGSTSLRHKWTIWYRPPTSKNSDYEKSIKQVGTVSTAVDFWRLHSHLSRPSHLPTVSDYHFFKEGIRPVWEDDENRKGGKWIMRFKKGVADRYWESLLLAMVGDQFAEASDEVCGAVLSVRSGEDVLSIWTKHDGGRNVKIRDTVKRELELPSDTIIVWKSHDDSIAQRSALDQARHEKHAEKRRVTLSREDGNAIKEKLANA